MAQGNLYHPFHVILRLRLILLPRKAVPRKFSVRTDVCKFVMVVFQEVYEYAARYCVNYFRFVAFNRATGPDVNIL
jgi:hypothetical protein